jgi:hypothetical protein
MRIVWLDEKLPGFWLNDGLPEYSHLVQTHEVRLVLIMRLIVSLILAAAALSSGQLPADPGREQGQVRKDMRAGNVRSLREIEQRVLPTMRGMQYLGPEYDPVAMAYRLKFIHDGRVVFVDVDARTGMVIGQFR